MIQISRLHHFALPLATALVVAACGVSESQGIATVKERIAKGDHKAAEATLKSLIQKYPKSGEGRYLLGKQLLERGDMNDAVPELQRARALKFDDNKTLPALAEALLRKGRLKELAEEFAAVTLSDAAANAELQAHRASAHAALGEVDKAQAIVDAALKVQPQSVDARMVQARLLARQHDMKGGMAVLDGLIAAHPNNDDAWAGKGNFLEAQPGNQAAAEAAYRKALATNPLNLEARLALCRLELGRNRLDAAEAELRTLRKNAPESSHVALLDANLALARGHHARARSLFQALRKGGPNHLGVLLGSAETELRLNALEQAQTLAARALTVAPQSHYATRLLGRVQLQKGDADKASRTLAPLVALERPEPVDLALAMRAAQLQADTGKAELLYQRLARSKPEDPKLRTLLATSHYNKVKPEEVVTQLQAIANADASGTSAEAALLTMHMRAARYDQALVMVDSIQRKLPAGPEPDRLRAAVLERKGDRAGARHALEQALAKDPGNIATLSNLTALDVSDGNPEVAKDRYKDLLRKQPKNTMALLALAQLNRLTGASLNDITKLLEQAIKDNPQDRALRVALIQHHTSRGDKSGAVAAAAAAVAAMSDDGDMLERLAELQLDSSAPDQALASYVKLSSLPNEQTTGLLGVSRSHLARGDFAQAKINAEKLLASEPQLLDAHVVLVTALLKQKKFDAARQAALALKAEYKDQSLPYQLEADIAAAQGNMDMAIDLLRQALDKQVPGKTPYRLHSTLLKAGRTAEADAMAAQWLKSHPKDADFLFYVAERSQTRGDLPTATARYKQLLEVNPTHAFAMNNLATLSLAQKQNKEAQGYIEQGLKTAPNHPELLDTQAEIFAAEREWAKAIEAQARAVETSPKSVDMRLKLARYQIEGGKKLDAKAELGRLANANLALSDGQKAALRQAREDLTR